MRASLSEAWILRDPGLLESDVALLACRQRRCSQGIGREGVHGNLAGTLRLDPLAIRATVNSLL
jgi:hypothetical protein